MTLSKNGTSALATLATGFTLAVLDITTMVGNHDWMKAMPHWWHAAEPSLINVFTPIVILVAGLGAALVLRGDRRGYGLLIVWGIGGLLVSIFSTYERLASGLFQASVICAVQIITNVAILYFAGAALQEKEKESADAPMAEAET